MVHELSKIEDKVETTCHATGWPGWKLPMMMSWMCCGISCNKWEFLMSLAILRNNKLMLLSAC